MYERYKYETYYYEILEFIRKFVLVGAIMFLMPGSVMQISMGFIISTIFYIIHIRLQAYQDDIDNNMQSSTLLASMITLFSAILLKAVQNTENDTGYGKEFFEFLVPSSNILVLILLVYVIFIDLKSKISNGCITLKKSIK